jgi:FkbM family methyltransferase
MIQRWLIELVRNGAALGSAGRSFAHFIETAHFAAANLNYFEIVDNGELWLIRQVARKLEPRYVIDIGANQGEWLRGAALEMPNAQIVACEPQPLLASALRTRYANERITVKQVAMGASPGVMDLVCYPGHDSLASGVDWHKGRPSERIKVDVMSGAELVRALGWPRVDFVKIDVEGMELEALKGFGPLLDAAAIGVIQFEFGVFALQQRILMRDFCELLGGQYKFGRLQRNHIAFSDYDFRWESSEMSNFVACRTDLLERLTA